MSHSDSCKVVLEFVPFSCRCPTQLSSTANDEVNNPFFLLVYLTDMVGYFRCSPCECDISGSVNDSCYSLDNGQGQCNCKELVEGYKCTTCKDGSGDLDASNPFGCSKGLLICFRL